MASVVVGRTGIVGCLPVDRQTASYQVLAVSFVSRRLLNVSVYVHPHSVVRPAANSVETDVSPISCLDYDIAAIPVILNVLVSHLWNSTILLDLSL